MHDIFIEKPYKFVRPVMSEWLPRLMNNRLIHIPLLRFGDSIVSVESCGADRLRKSIEAGHAVMLIGNHPRISDPVALYDLIRQAKTNMFAMASWHLFNKGWFQRCVLRLYGAFSVNREGLDRESINFAIDALKKNVRPVLMFPEGATTGTNESLMPFLDGPTFVARTVARRRHKMDLKTVIHPIVFRYQLIDGFQNELDRAMSSVESILGIEPESTDSNASRVRKALNALVVMREQAFDIEPDDSLSSYQRRQHVADAIMQQAEDRCFGGPSRKDMTNRVRDVRSEVFPEILSDKNLSRNQIDTRWRDLERTSIAWQLACCPENYLSEDPSNQRILEIAIRIYEDLNSKMWKWGRQKVFVKCLDAIEVPAEKHRGSAMDPLVQEVREALQESMVRAKKND